MGATVHSQSRHGLADESAATGLTVASMSTKYAVETTFVKNHIGCNVGFSLFNDTSEVTCSGVVAVKATGIVPDLAAAITLANASVDSLSTNSKNLFSTPVGGAGLIVTGATLNRVNNDFENGDLTSMYNPLVSLSSPTVLT